MKILTLRQPHASLVATGAKTIETRSWRTDYRGPLAIHAAKRSPDSMMAFYDLDTEGFLPIDFPDEANLPYGVIVAIANLQHVRLMGMMSHWLDGQQGHHWSYGKFVDGEHRQVEVSENDLRFGFWRADRYAWFLGNVEAVDPPIPWKGAQGLREFDQSILPERYRRQEHVRFGIARPLPEGSR